MHVNTSISRMTKDMERMCKKNRKLVLTVMGGALAGLVAIMVSKL